MKASDVDGALQTYGTAMMDVKVDNVEIELVPVVYIVTLDEEGEGYGEHRCSVVGAAQSLEGAKELGRMSVEPLLPADALKARLVWTEQTEGQEWRGSLFVTRIGMPDREHKCGLVLTVRSVHPHR